MKVMPLTHKEVAALMRRQLLHGHDLDLEMVERVGNGVYAVCRRCSIWVWGVTIIGETPSHSAVYRGGHCISLKSAGLDEPTNKV